jgi:hypothetical protein
MSAAQREAERAVEIVGERPPPLRASVAVRVAQDDDFSIRRAGEEDVAVRREDHVARIVEILGPERDAESRRNDEPRVRWPPYDARRIAGAGGVVRRRKAVGADFVMAEGLLNRFDGPLRGAWRLRVAARAGEEKEKGGGCVRADSHANTMRS